MTGLNDARVAPYTDMGKISEQLGISHGGVAAQARSMKAVQINYISMHRIQSENHSLLFRWKRSAAGSNNESQPSSRRQPTNELSDLERKPKRSPLENVKVNYMGLHTPLH